MEKEKKKVRKEEKKQKELKKMKQKKEATKQKEKKPKKDKRDKKSKITLERQQEQISEKVSFWPLYLPYYIFNDDTLNFQDTEILMNTNVPAICIYPPLSAEWPDNWRNIFKSLSNNNSITSLTASTMLFTILKVQPAEIIRLAPDSLKEFSLLCPRRISLRSVDEICKAIREKKTLERICLTELVGVPDQYYPTDPLPLQLCKLIKEAKHIKGYMLDKSCCDFSILESLKSATHVIDLSFKNLVFQREEVQILGDIMTRVTKLSLEACDYTNFQNFAEHLAISRSLTSLSLSSLKNFVDINIILKVAMSSLSHLEELSLGHIQSEELHLRIADLLQANKTLTKLSFTNCDIQETDCDAIMNALQRNTTLTHLSFAAEKLTSESIGRYLQTNRSLKTLELKKCLRVESLDEISKALEVNTTLTSLHIKRSASSEELPRLYKLLYNQHFISNGNVVPFIKALKVNKTLKNLSFDFEGALSHITDFLVALQNNPNLTQLLLYPKVRDEMAILQGQNWNGVVTSELTKKVIELLRTNIGLKVIDVYVVDDNLTPVKLGQTVYEQQHKNREIRRSYSINAATLMKIAVLRPNFLGTHLPLEIWRLIFSFFGLQAIGVNSSKLFSSIVKSLNKH